MGLTSSIIETGVDKLVKLVNTAGRVSSYDAAKELGVSNTIIMEWADFLEEEGIIKVEYKFTKPFLVTRKLGKKEVEEKAKEFSGKKDVFVRKAEVSLSFLDRESEKLKGVKEEFEKIKKNLGFDLDDIKNELQELTKYEQLKIDLDKKIGEQKTSSIDKIQEMITQISRERQKYNSILMELKKEENVLGKEKSEVKSIEESEKLIKDRLKGLKNTIKNVENKVKAEEDSFHVSESNIQKLIAMADGIKAKVENEKGLIEPLVQKSENQAESIQQLQNTIIKKIEDKEKKLKGTKKAAEKLKTFFKKKLGVLTLIDKVNEDRNNLETELIGLIKKAKSFQLTSKTADVGTQIISFEKKFKDVDEKKKFFEKELKKLSSYFK
ncbi:MAG: hypothetical protein IIC69_00295 [Nanoarchaeota archaeon]|nr:hypothetical protein [Nanoarchaeota archaeon]